MTNNPNTILLLESGDLEVYQGKDPRRYYHSGYQNEGPEVIHEWLSTKRIVKMEQGEYEKTRSHIFPGGVWQGGQSYAVDVSDIVEILPDKKISHGKFAKNIDMLGYFKEPVREVDVTWDLAFSEADEWLKTKHPIGSIIGYNHSQLIEYLSKHFTINRK